MFGLLEEFHAEMMRRAKKNGAASGAVQ